MSLNDRKGTETAAARAGFSRSTGYRVAHAGADGQAPQARPRRGRRRPYLLAGTFDEKLVPLLEADASLRACDLYEKLLEDHPEPGPGVRRTGERRVQACKLAHGPDKWVLPSGRTGPQASSIARNASRLWSQSNSLRGSMFAKGDVHDLIAARRHGLSEVGNAARCLPFRDYLIGSTQDRVASASASGP